jgi:hypothetical protein
MSEKVLFELRVNGDQVEIYTAPEWDEYHNPQLRFRAFRKKRKRSAADSLRHTLDSLQDIYDDLYNNSPAQADT